MTRVYHVTGAWAAGYQEADPLIVFASNPEAYGYGAQRGIFFGDVKNWTYAGGEKNDAYWADERWATVPIVAISIDVGPEATLKQNNLGEMEYFLPHDAYLTVREGDEHVEFASRKDLKQFVKGQGWIKTPDLREPIPWNVITLHCQVNAAPRAEGYRIASFIHDRVSSGATGGTVERHYKELGSYIYHRHNGGEELRLARESGTRICDPQAEMVLVGEFKRHGDQVDLELEVPLRRGSGTERRSFKGSNPIDALQLCEVMFRVDLGVTLAETIRDPKMRARSGQFTRSRGDGRT